MIGWPATERNNRKKELDPISTEERLRQLFAVNGCIGTEFSYVIFTEQRNFTTAKRQRKNDNGMVETRHMMDHERCSLFELRQYFAQRSLLFLKSSHLYCVINNFI